MSCDFIYQKLLIRQQYIFDIQTSVNIESDFLAMNFLKIMGGPGEIGLLSINFLRVETIDA